MSYCRFSTDQFQCDLYVYYSVGDFYAIHVANRRVVYHRPLPPDVPWPRPGATKAETRKWARRYMKGQRDMAKIGRHHKPIGGPFDGETFNEPTIDAAIARLESLRAAGYRFPDDVIAELREEQAEEAAEEAGATRPTGGQ